MVQLTLESTDSLVPRLQPTHEHWRGQGYISAVNIGW